MSMSPRPETPGYLCRSPGGALAFRVNTRRGVDLSGGRSSTVFDTGARPARPWNTGLGDLGGVGGRMAWLRRGGGCSGCDGSRRCPGGVVAGLV